MNERIEYVTIQLGEDNALLQCTNSRHLCLAKPVPVVSGKTMISGKTQTRVLEITPDLIQNAGPAHLSKLNSDTFDIALRSVEMTSRTTLTFIAYTVDEGKTGAPVARVRLTVYPSGKAQLTINSLVPNQPKPNTTRVTMFLPLAPAK